MYREICHLITSHLSQNISLISSGLGYTILKDGEQARFRMRMINGKSIIYLRKLPEGRINIRNTEKGV